MGTESLNEIVNQGAENLRSILIRSGMDAATAEGNSHSAKRCRVV